MTDEAKARLKAIERRYGNLAETHAEDVDRNVPRMLPLGTVLKDMLWLCGVAHSLAKGQTPTAEDVLQVEHVGAGDSILRG